MLNDPVIGAHVACMAQVLDIERIKVHVYETPTINGLAAPDGRVFVTRGFLDKYRLDDICEVLFSPCSGTLDATELAEWILQDQLNVRFQVQLHKYLWGDKPGV